jgi:pimeloyl-ACP methyl ester carboxylesterase
LGSRGRQEDPFKENIMDRRPVISAFVLVLVGILRASPASQATVAQGATLAVASPVAAGDFSDLVDIGGRKIYLECRGHGSPTVILESGAGAWGDIWSRDYKQPADQRTTVIPGVAQFTHVCAYDRPGTIGDVNPDLDPRRPPFYPSRSDPVPQPRTSKDMVAELHALLQAAHVPGPYVLVGHSAGGLVVRLFASTYPDEVVGMVLLDSTPVDIWHRFQAALTPEQWAKFEAGTISNPELEAVYPDAERLWTAPLADTPTTEQVRQAQAESPLRPMPLIVLSHGIPFAAPFPGCPARKWKRSCSTCRRIWPLWSPMLTLPPPPRAGTKSTRTSRKQVIAAIREVVEAVRNPSTRAPAP